MVLIPATGSWSGGLRQRRRTGLYGVDTMPAPYLDFLDLRLIAARCERRLAGERQAFGDLLRWGMEEAACRAGQAERHMIRVEFPNIGQCLERGTQGPADCDLSLLPLMDRQTVLQ